VTKDARFEDGGEKPLNLGAMDGEDLAVLSSLVQDAILPVTEMTWRPGERRFGLLLNRFRWEDADAANKRGRAVERVQSVLVFENVLRVSTQGIDRSDPDLILSVLSVAYTETEDEDGYVEITLAGDGGIRLQVEALEGVLKDVTRPYLAPSKAAPQHDA
jgi:hypothetical protein